MSIDDLTSDYVFVVHNGIAYSWKEYFHYICSGEFESFGRNHLRRYNVRLFDRKGSFYLSLYEFGNFHYDFNKRVMTYCKNRNDDFNFKLKRNDIIFHRHDDQDIYFHFVIKNETLCLESVRGGFGISSFKYKYFHLSGSEFLRTCVKLKGCVND